MEQKHSHFPSVLLKGKTTSLLVDIYIYILFSLKIYYISVKEQLKQHISLTKA